jgi:hypothetical protein
LARFITVVARFIIEFFFFGCAFFVGLFRADEDFFAVDFFPDVLFFAAFLAIWAPCGLPDWIHTVPEGAVFVGKIGGELTGEIRDVSSDL